MTSKLTMEQAKRLRNDFECWQQDYDPKDDKEQYDMFGRGMAAMDMLIAGMYQEPVAYIGKQWTLVYYTPPMSMGLKIGDKLYRHAQQPVDNTFIPKNLDKALGVVGVALPESKEEFNFQIERWIQRLIDRVIRYSDEFKEQPAPVVPDERAAFNAWNNEDNLPIAGVGAKNAAWLAWQARAELAGNSPVIGIDPASGPDRTVEVSYVAPPGYVMVPKEPTPEMMAVINEAIKSMRGSAATYARVLAAAQQEMMKDEANNLSPK